MTSIAGIVAGIALIGGAVAVSRIAGRRIDGFKNAFKSQNDPAGQTDAFLDYEKDPKTGVFRPKQL